MGYNIGNWGKAKTDFRHVFGVDIQYFYDGLTTCLFGKICIDPFKFDDYLHGKYGDYENDGKSMQDVIVENYGEEGFGLIVELS